MKIIGTTELPGTYAHLKVKGYVCIISQDELKKIANKTYAGRDEKEIDPKVGDDYPIAEGYDFRGELLQAIKAMQDAYSKFAKVAPVAARFAGLSLAADQREAA